MQSSEELNRGDTPRPAGSRRRAGNKREGYAVGYGKPPAEHCFQKGKSGNPKGRPKKVELVEATGPAPARRSMQEMFESVAYRMVRLRRGDSVEEMPLIEAGMLEIGLKAARGGRLSFATMVQTAVKLGLDDFVEPEPRAPAWDMAEALDAARERVFAAERQARAELAAQQAEIDRAKAEERAAQVDEEVERRTEEEVARRVEEAVQRRIAEEMEPRVEAEVRQRKAEMEEALAYKQIWQAAIDTAEGMAFAMDPPEPHPDEVVIDTENLSVTYTVPLKPGQTATLANLRADLAELREKAAEYALRLPRATTEQGEATARGLRDGARKVCAVMEAMLARVPSADGRGWLEGGG